MQMELIHKRTFVELLQAASISVRSHQREADHKQELLTRIWQLQEQETKVEKLKEQLGHNRLCKRNLNTASSKKLRQKEDSLAEACETTAALREDLRIAVECDKPEEAGEVPRG